MNLKVINKLEEMRTVYLTQQEEKLKDGNIRRANIYSQIAEGIHLMIVEIKKR